MTLPNNPKHPSYRHSRSASRIEPHATSRANALRFPDYLSNVSIDELDLSERSHNALVKNHTLTVGQLVLLSDERLLRIQSFGRKSLSDVHRALDEFLAAHSAQLNHEASNADATSEPPRGSACGTSSGGWAIPKESTFGESNQSDSSAADLLLAPVEMLDLSTRARNVLARLRIHSIAELLAYPKRKMMFEENMGRKTLNEIQSRLLAYLSSNPGTENSSAGTTTTTAPTGTKDFVESVLSRLPERDRAVLKDRYGLWDGIAETLQDIGGKLGVTRERIRQIEAKALKRLRRVYGYGLIHRFLATKVARYLTEHKEMQGILDEDDIASAFADDCSTEETVLAFSFLQELCDGPLMGSMAEGEKGIRCVDKEVASEYKTLLKAVEITLEQHRKPLSEYALCESLTLGQDKLSEHDALILHRILAVSPTVLHLNNDTIVLSSWTEFHRRDVRSLAVATLRVLGKPAHFTEIAAKISTLFPDAGSVNLRALQNALIYNRNTFVWVKNGTYGLAAWGLAKPPFIKDRLIELLSSSNYPLPYWHLKEGVLEVCNCKEPSVRMTLDLNPKVFKKFDGDQYGLQRHYQ